MPALQHHCFYWRVAPEQVDAAIDATRRWQQGLTQERPTLAARLYVRHEPARSTVMETYECDAQQLSVLRSDGDQLSAAWRLGERHLESFTNVT